MWSRICGQLIQCPARQHRSTAPSGRVVLLLSPSWGYTPGLILKSLRDSKPSPPVHIFDATPQNPFEDEDDDEDEDDYERRGTRPPGSQTLDPSFIQRTLQRLDVRLIACLHDATNLYRRYIGGAERPVMGDLFHACSRSGDHSG